MKIFSNFESANIEIVTAESAENIQLRIPVDNQSDISQWFHFRLESKPHQEHTFSILGLAKSAYPQGWENYNVVASYDRKEWFRIATTFDGDTLSFKVAPEYASMYFAYFAPYSNDRHQDLLHYAQTQSGCQLQTLGLTLDENNISLLSIGEPSKTKKNIWITARQHPGETMAQWFVEGLLLRLLDETDTVARALLDVAVLHIVPNMNPDGSIRGHLRCNGIGVNLNREWQSPSMQRSPEVFFVREKMLEIGVDMYLDIHGDEAISYNFVAGSEGVPSYNKKMEDLENTFKQALLTITPEFQDEHGYDKDKPGCADLTIASNWVAEQFKCLSYTLEMPFKDHISHADERYGWSPERSIAFGQDTLSAIWVTSKKL
ncbi:peptidase M14, carboxypeptidase A [Psychromonas sp. CNPT3]|uniref:M14 family metallopeptidase n=1 Tax=Psychromonas sp. CNPT3 TaxID=314282 RepID=UPI00006E8A9F|nr:M14-type cytosolic carboxypeptidase [Psychromonas sp. CNPT3]AGH80515.1 peptidase M14, carboxypeptidase A [Psychromonas sp. CNPT3]